MPDRDRVIGGLAALVIFLGDKGDPISTEQAGICADALTLLTDTTSWIKEPDRRNHWHCEKCGYVVGLTALMYKYCPKCGRKVTGEVKYDG